MRNPALVQVLGPLAPFTEGFRQRLEMLGYAPQSRVVHLRVMAHLSSWLEERGLDGSALSASVAGGFMDDRRAAGHRDARSGRSLRPLMEYLWEIGAAPQPVPQQVVGPVEEVLADYAAYLLHERGLAVPTVQRSTDLVRPFLAAQAAGDRLNLEALTAADVTAFVIALVESVSPATVQRTGTALRSLLRFLHLRGTIGSSLVGAVPTAANWKLAGLPKYLTQEQVAAMVASCDRNTAVGRRDLASLTLLGRLGLRAARSPR
ncbi:tyrosine-type recombinase/integrase [Streptomyces chiangmaiensis]